MRNKWQGGTNGSGQSSAKKRWLLGMTAAVMLTAVPIVPAVSAAAATVPTITAVAKVVKPIYLSINSYINLVDVTLSPTENGQTAAFTLSVYNGENRELDLSDYWYRLSTTAGGMYSIKSQDSSVTKIASKSKQFITLYASVGEQTKLSDLQLKIIKFDFNVASYEKTIGTFKFPANYTNIVGEGSYKTLYFPTTTFNTKVYNASIGASGDDNLATVNFVYNNIGKKAVTLTGYKYYIVTSGGLMYEATPSETGDITIDPLVREEIQLTANIPSAIKTSGWKLLVVKTGAGENAVTLPVGMYQIGFSNNQTSSNASDSFNYKTSEGSYQFKLLELLREPWKNQDILSARIRITNKSTESVTIPDIAGYFYLDDKVKLNFTTVTSNNQFGLNPSDYVDVDVYAKLPSNYDYSKVRLVVNDKIDDKTTTKAGELLGSASLTSLPIYKTNEAYNITHDGGNMTATLNYANVFTSAASKLFRVQMTLSNAEKRTIDPTKLVAGFMNAEGDYIPATVSTGTASTNPSNKALLNVSASLPLNYDTSDLQLIVGEAVTETSYTSGTTEPTAYVNAAKFTLPGLQAATNKMQNLSLLPYSLSINTYTASIFNDELELTLKYDLLKDATYNSYTNDRKLIFNIEATDVNDGTQYVYATQTVGLDADSGDTLVSGTNNEITLKTTMNYSTISSNLNFMARVYEIVDGSKRLVAEHPFRWYVDNDWKTQDTATNISN